MTFILNPQALFYSGLYKWKQLSHFCLFHFTCERHFHLKIMALFSSHGFNYMGDGSSSSSSSNDEMLELCSWTWIGKVMCSYSSQFIWHVQC
jgi:hypothetical protein